VTTSLRNKGLLDGIADTFIKAVLQFCDDPTLQYNWMRYLPQDNEMRDQFWNGLIPKIKDRLGRTPVLRPRSEGSLRLINALRLHANIELDKAGNPLFDDIKPEAYLSSRYQRVDLLILRPYGLQLMYMNEILKRVDRDLQSPLSKMKSSATDEEWHSRAAKLLLLPFDKSWTQAMVELQAMDLLPLQDGRWVSAKNGHIYYAENGEIPIPRDLGLSLIDPNAARNIDRKTLFDRLGVQEASTTHVRNSIFERYKRNIKPGKFDLSNSRHHLEYLYLTHNPQECSPSQFQNLEVYCQTGILYMPHRNDIYIATNEPYGAQELLKPTERGKEPGSGAPGLTALFLHQGYFEDAPKTPTGHKLQWTEWLHTYIKIRRSLRLTVPKSNIGPHLSSVCQYVANYRPERFLGMLRNHWKFEGEAIARNLSLMSELEGTKVLCKGNRRKALAKTYLPIPLLERLCARFMNDTEWFPFLKLEVPVNDETYPKEWEFLHNTFGVGIRDDCDFHLAMVKAILDANGSAETAGRNSRICDLYQVIQARFLDERSNQNDKFKYVNFSDILDRVLTSLQQSFSIACAIFIKAGNFYPLLWKAGSHVGSVYPMPLGCP